MNNFQLWFSTGLQHIIDWQAYDHILFVSLLTLTYPFKEWKKLLVLVTAFTLGHCVSLVLSVTNTIVVRQALVEFLIAGSILASAVYNLWSYKKNIPAKPWLIYSVVGMFGLIHGLGFSYLLRSMLGTGQNVALPLLYFNAGLELGQLIIVLFVVLFSLFLTRLLKIPFSIYKIITVCCIALISLKLCVTRFPDLF
jgi:hypothetical protein